EARARPERVAPAVMLPVSATCRNRRRSIRSKCIVSMSRTEAGSATPALWAIGGARKFESMENILPHLVPIIAIFLLGGFVKGVIGLGLPTVAMGLLGLCMPPAQAASRLLVPLLVMNLWQLFS